MTRISKRGFAAGLMGFLICAPALADTPPPAPQKTLDPNQIVCEKQEVIGSRLQTKRVCMTRAQWADARLQDRQDLEKIQVQRGMKGE